MGNGRLWLLLVILLMLMTPLPAFSRSSTPECGSGLQSGKGLSGPSYPRLVASPSSIIVNGADSIWTTSATHSQGLVDAASTVAPRVIAEYANSTEHYDLSDVPISLRSLIEVVAPHLIIDHANSTEHYDLNDVPASLRLLVEAVAPHLIIDHANSTRHFTLNRSPGTLQTLIGAVAPRVTVQYANSTWARSLSYPAGLMNDSTAPQISAVAHDVTGSDSAIITWNTDEFADSKLAYGIQTGLYTDTITNPLYTKQHAITLTNLIPETPYYYQVSSTDRSGNTATSSEYSFTVQAQMWVYLPLTARNN